MRFFKRNQDKEANERKAQLRAVLVQLSSQRPSDVWRGIEQVRQWLTEDPENRDVYGLLLDAVKENRYLREQIRGLLSEMIQKGSTSANEAMASLPYSIQDLLSDADDAYYAAEYNRAIQLYQQILKLDPDNTRVKEYLNRAIISRDSPDVQTNIPRVALQYYRRARSLIASRHVVTAINLLNAAIEAAQVKGMEYPEAEEALNQMQDLLIANEYIEEANTAIREKRGKDALDLYNKALVLDPTNETIRRELKGLQDSLRVDSRQAEKLLRQAKTAIAKKQHQNALQYLEKALKFDQTNNIVYDELIKLLVEIGRLDRKKGMESIIYTAANYGSTARNALLELTAYDLQRADNLQKISDISNMLSWLPHEWRTDMQDILHSLNQVSQHARAALETETLYNKQEQLRMGQSIVEGIQKGLTLVGKANIAQHFIPVLSCWNDVLSKELAMASLEEQIPNVYVAGSPLKRNSLVFKGRKDLFSVLSNELVNPSGQRPAILLFGARRMGKTSTLKQLPVRLGPSIIPVSIDLQERSTVANAKGLLYWIARDISKCAYEERRLSLPELTIAQMEEDPYFVFQEWLEQVEKALGDFYWVLLALDEYESLGDMKDAGRIDERIFQLLRGLIQGHPRFTVLMSGAHTLEELLPYWSNYFINVKTLKVGPLLDADAIELITHPIEDFPLTYDQEALEYLLRETGCHPNWLQLACRETVEKLNNEKRFHAYLEDVKYAIAKVPEVLSGEFGDFWQGRDSNEIMRSILKNISATNEGMEEKKLQEQFAGEQKAVRDTLDFLIRRDILSLENGIYNFRAKLLGRWVARQ